MRALAVVVLATGLAACSGGAANDVPWEDYAPSVRTEIEAAAQARDCPALQKRFDAADSTNEVTRKRTGHNNADLMNYIDGLMREAGCYD